MSVSNYSEFVAALAVGGTVALNPKAVITITASTQIRKSGTRITSVDPAQPGTIVLESGADWSGPLLYGSGLTNLTFDNFVIDGNFDSQGGKPRGKGYFNLCNLRDCQNIVIHDMKMKDGGCDGFQFRGCKYIKAYDNDVQYLGHDVFYFIGSNSEIEVYDNDVLTFTNSAVRLSYGCQNAWIHDNYFHSVFTGGSTGPAIEIDKHGFSGILIEDNIIENVNGAGIWMTGDALNKGSIVIKNNVFFNTGVYKSYTGYSNAAIVNGNMDGVLVEKCTFIGGHVAYSTFDRNGLSLSFNTTFKNCIFVDAEIAAFRMTDAGGSVNVINSNFYGNKALAIDSYTSKATFTGSTTVNPMLTSKYLVSSDSALYGKGIGYNSSGTPTPDPDPIENEEPPVNTKNVDVRLVSASPGTVYTGSPYIDVGKSSYSTYRAALWFDLSAYKTPVYKAELQLCWYYPAGKTRINDSVVEVYRPADWSAATATWTKNASNYIDSTNVVGGTKAFSSLTFQGETVPDNAYHKFDVTELVNKYITGEYTNTGFLLKTALENNDYIAFYSNTQSLAPKLVITAVPAAVDVKVPIDDSLRFKESQSQTVLDNNVYLDIGKSTGSARFQVSFDLTRFKEPVESAKVMLAWYYPQGKSRLADTIVTAYRPLAALSNNMTWSNSSNNFDNTKSYGATTIKAAVLPDGKFEAIDITELVNAYIAGTYTNTGVFLKASIEGNNYIAFHGESAIENTVKPYILVKTTETLK